MEATKNIWCVNDEGTDDQRIVKKSQRNFTQVEDHTRSCKPKRVDFEPVHQDIEANPVTCSKRIPGEFGFSQSSVVCCSHRSISSHKSMPLPSDLATHWPIRGRAHWFLLPL